jgi:hypothetical protein
MAPVQAAGCRESGTGITSFSIRGGRKSRGARKSANVMTPGPRYRLVDISSPFLPTASNDLSCVRVERSYGSTVCRRQRLNVCCFHSDARSRVQLNSVTRTDIYCRAFTDHPSETFITVSRSHQLLPSHHLPPTCHASDAPKICSLNQPARDTIHQATLQYPFPLTKMQSTPALVWSVMRRNQHTPASQRFLMSQSTVTATMSATCATASI